MKDIPKNSFLTRLAFAYKWNMRTAVLTHGVKELFFALIESIATFAVSFLNILFSIFGLVFVLPIWLLAPIFTAAFRGEGVDKVIAMKLTPDQK